MLRLSPPGFERFLQSPQFVATFGGGEANVAVSLAQFGVDSYYVTQAARSTPSATPPCARSAPKACAPTYIVRGGDRVGVYFTETGASSARVDGDLRPRATPPSAQMKPGTWTGPTVFAGADWFHVTGITPALGERGAASTARGARSGQGRRSAGERRPELPQEALVRGRGAKDDAPLDASCRRGHRQRGRHAVGARLHVPDTDVTGGQLNVAGYRKVARAVVERVRSDDRGDYAA